MTTQRSDGTVRAIYEAAMPSDVARRLGMGNVKNGKDLVACPFHDDKKPSLKLYDNPSNPHFHCFACGAHGNVFKLVQKVQNTDFLGALDWLANQYSIQRNRSGSARSPKIDERLEGLKRALEIFGRWNNQSVLKDFLERRKFDPKIAPDCQLMAVPANCLSSEILSQRNAGKDWISLQVFLEIGGMVKLLEATPGTNYQLDLGAAMRDIFFDWRIIFPVMDVNNVLQGFVGRRLDDSSTAPKYLFSRGFKKSECLYRADRAKRMLDQAPLINNQYRQLFVVEGLMDALRLESLGIPAVSILGADISDKQVAAIEKLSDSLPNKEALCVSVFLDRDLAGRRGAAKLIKALAKKSIDVELIWPLNSQLLKLGLGSVCKDPDEILQVQVPLDTLALIDQWKHPPALLLLADELEVTPDDVVSDISWNEISVSRRARAISAVRKLLAEPGTLLRTPTATPSTTEASWAISFRNGVDVMPGRTLVRGQFIVDDEARLNLARLLAFSGAQRGDMAQDVAAWQRIDLAATAFNAAFRTRLRSTDSPPIEPFDAMYVSRGFGKTEPRLKVMPCPEDLIVQQYLLNELLTERFDQSETESYSRLVPAVRFYRESQARKTTGTRNTDIAGAVSFAYQIDMDVLEGRQPQTVNGFFRPYFDCWRDFLRHLQVGAKQMTRVHTLRLDAKRYYDEIQRTLIRDLLKPAIEKAVLTLGEDHAWAPLFLPNMASRSSALVDWMCDQSFGFEYYEPEKGKILKSDLNKGIPQGPVLSAWLGTIALFDLDEAMCAAIEKYKAMGQHAVYARYVDDIVLIADSAELLSVLHAKAEDVARKLSVQLLQKAEPVQVMDSNEFAEFLTKGRALAASEPDAEPVIFHTGDGEAGWENYSWDSNQEIQRDSALQLLHDNRLYDAELQFAKDQLHTAFLAPDLRAKDVAKASRWLWFHAALAHSKDVSTSLWQSYQQSWIEITRNIQWANNTQKIPWEDPAFYALEGLEKLLELVHGLDPACHRDHLKTIKTLAKQVVEKNFIRRFIEGADSASAEPEPGTPKGWGAGTKRLSRMFWNHALTLRMKALRMLGASPTIEVDSVADHFNDITTSNPLKRALITNYQACALDKKLLLASSGESESSNQLRPAIIRLHEVICHFEHAQNDDPLAAQLSGLTKLADIADEFVQLVQFLFLNGDALEATNAAHLALATLVAISPREKVWELLSNRTALTQSLAVATTPLPTLPGVQPTGLDFVVFGGATGETFQLIETLKNLSWISNDQPNNLPVATISGGLTQSSNNPIDWENSNLSTEVKFSKANISKLQLRALNSPPHLEPTARTIHWVADVYEALAKLNYDDENEDPREYVAAWQYLAVSHEPNLEAPSPLSVALICTPTQRSKLGHLAFKRMGSRGLQSVSVPIEQAHLWRAGVMLSDLTGFADDIDRYHADLSDFPQIDVASETLKYALRRLRGAHSEKMIYRPAPGKPYLPATLNRLLDGLRKFPTDRDQGISYALALRFESSAMAVRLRNKNLSLLNADSIAHFLEIATQQAFKGMPSSIARLLPNASDIQGNHRYAITGWLMLCNRVSQLQEPTSGHLSQCWRLLSAGLVVATVGCRLRSMALELVADEFPSISPQLEEAVTSEWSISRPQLIISESDEPSAQLSTTFVSALTESPAKFHSNLRGVTPLGWLALIADLLGVLDTSTALKKTRFVFDSPNPDRWEKLKNSFKVIATHLTSPTSAADPESSEAWPFEFQSGASQFDDEFLRIAFDLLDKVDALSGTTVQEASGRWSLDVSNRTFIDSKNRQLPIRHWSIFYLGNGNIATTLRNSEYVSEWTESRNKVGELIGISAWREDFSRLLTRQNHPRKLEDGKHVVQKTEVPTPHNDKVLEDTGEIKEPTEESTSDTWIAGRDHSKILSALVAAQQRCWNTRSAPSNSHIRVAMVQWKVDHSYHHPLHDSDEFVNKTKSKEKYSYPTLPASLPSKIEHRRRKIISKVLESCHAFRVDVIVLPEYCVRPDTVVWLKAELQSKGYKFSVLAGTYRLYGNCTQAGFKDALGEAFGVDDYDKIFSSDDCTAASAGERSSFLSLLVPSRLNSGFGSPSAVSVFTRRKKYAAAGMKETFNPGISAWKPLFSLGALLSDRRRRDSKFNRSNKNAHDISADELIALAAQHLPEQYLAELICSELFLATNPANLSGIVSEHVQGLAKYGSAKSTENAMKDVLDDIVSLSNALGHRSRSAGQLDLIRRTLLIVPAMTTRSKDYWIFGQSLLLSAGSTTVFCNAAGIDSVGGTCAIGHDSWTKAKKHDGIQIRNTPYSGWSRGIYYGDDCDALGKNEQAVAIVDIDPIHMSEGKPRPQTLPVPMQLVAHLPLIETLEAPQIADENAKQGAKESTKKATVDFVKLVNKILTMGRIAGKKTVWDPATTNKKIQKNKKVPKKLSELVSEISEFLSDDGAMKSRTQHWATHWKDQPWAKEPPAVFDFIWIDGDDSVGAPTLFVPPYSE